jgi:hypothetical protein
MVFIPNFWALSACWRRPRQEFKRRLRENPSAPGLTACPATYHRPEAGTLIAEGVSIMEFGGSARVIACTCHARPTLEGP